MNNFFIRKKSPCTSSRNFMTGKKIAKEYSMRHFFPNRKSGRETYCSDDWNLSSMSRTCTLFHRENVYLILITSKVEKTFPESEQGVLCVIEPDGDEDYFFHFADEEFH